MPLRLVFALLVLPTAAHAGVYKCSLEGRVVYTDHPCYSDAPELELAPPIGEAAPDNTPTDAELARRYDAELAAQKARRKRADATFLRQHEEGKARAAAIRKAVIERRVIVGMDAAQVESAIGSPTSREQGRWVYVLAGQRTIIRFGTDGRVQRVQTRPVKQRRP